MILVVGFVGHGLTDSKGNKHLNEKFKKKTRVTEVRKYSFLPSPIPTMSLALERRESTLPLPSIVFNALASVHGPRLRVHSFTLDIC